MREKRYVFLSDGKEFVFKNKKIENKEVLNVKKLYNAGSLFTDKEQEWRKGDQEILKGIKERNENFDFYNPLFNEAINDKSNNPSSKDIYNGDVEELITSSILAIDGDDLEKDPGVAWEVGMVAGINLMLEKIKEVAALETYDKILSQIPMKKIYACYSDCRIPQNDKGIHKAVGFNQFTIGGLEQIGRIFEGKNSRHKMFEKIEEDL